MPSPGDLPEVGMELGPPASQADSSPAAPGGRRVFTRDQEGGRDRVRSGRWTCAQAHLLAPAGTGGRLNSCLSWGKSGDPVYSQDHSPEHSASSTGADRRGVSGQIREGPTRQRPAGRRAVLRKRPGCWPGKVPGLPGTGSAAGLPAHPGPGPCMARPPHGPGWQGSGRKGGGPHPAVPTQWKEPARLEVVLSLNHVKDLLTPAETGFGLRSFMHGAVWPLPLGSKASYRLNDA